MVEVGPGVNPELAEYAKAKGLPFLVQPDAREIDADAYDKFYDSVYGENK